MFVGDFTPGGTVSWAFTTRTAAGSASALSSGTAVIYKNAGTVESGSGVAVTASFDSRTGFNYITVDTSTDSSFYSAGGQFDAVLSTGTVNTVSVAGECLGRFTLGNQAAKPVLSVTGSVASVSGSVASVSGSVASVSGSVASVSGSVASVSGSVASVSGSVGGSVQGSVVGSVASVSGSVGGSVLGSVVGSVASVSGSVGGNIMGSVVGSVGNVAGSVASVSGSVGGSVLGNVSGSVGNVAGSVASVSGTVGTVMNVSTAVADTILTRQMTEAYAGVGTAPTLAQILFEGRALLAENSVASTTVTTKKIDGSTTAATYTLDDATSPTSITRTT